MPTPQTENASLAPRCQHTKLNGDPCGAPALRGKGYCCFRNAALATETYALSLLEDPLSVQLAIMQVVRRIHEDKIDRKSAGLMLYALQIASNNLKRFTDCAPKPPGDNRSGESLACILNEALERETKLAAQQREQGLLNDDEYAA